MIALLIEAAARSLLVALLVLAGLWTFRVGNVRAQKAAWGLVLAAAILMPLLLPVVARWSFLPANAGVVLPADPQTLLEELQARIQAKSSAARKPSLIAAQAPQPRSPQVEESAAPEPDRASGDRAPLPVDSNPDVAHPVEYAPSQPVTRQFAVSPATLAVLLYFVVLVALLCRLFYGLGSAFHIWQTAQPVAINDGIAIATGLPLRSSSAVASPVTIGSAIVLPADYAEWDAEKLRVVLAHERSHVGQGDFYLQLLVGFTQRFSGSARWAGGLNANFPIWPRLSATAPHWAKPPADPSTHRSCSNSRLRRARPS